MSLDLGFGGAQGRSASDPAATAPNDDKAHRLLNRVEEVVAPSRFTYLPDIRISYGAAGPVIQRWIDGKSATVWQSRWSTSTMNAFGADDLALVTLATRDVHLALVSYEAHRICRAFHVDGHRRWSLAIPGSPRIARPVASQSDVTEPLFVSIAYADDATTEAESYPPIECLLEANAAPSTRTS